MTGQGDAKYFSWMTTRMRDQIAKYITVKYGAPHLSLWTKMKHQSVYPSFAVAGPTSHDALKTEQLPIRKLKSAKCEAVSRRYVFNVYRYLLRKL